MRMQKACASNTMTLILAGGASRRMEGQHKAALPWPTTTSSTTLLQHILHYAKTQSDAQAINSNLPLNTLLTPPPTSNNHEWPRANNIDLIPDLDQQRLGPLAGLHAAMQHIIAQRHAYPGIEWILTLPCDAPFLPPNLLSQLATPTTPTNQNLVTPNTQTHNIQPPNPHQQNPNSNNFESVVSAQSLARSHYITALWPITLAQALAGYLNQGGRAVKHFLAQQHHIEVDFPSIRVDKATLIDPFFNINTHDDYLRALHYTQTNSAPINSTNTNSTDKGCR